MKHLQYIICIAIVSLMASCTKELDIDYDTIEPFYVIQGQITDEPAKVLLTQSRDMNDSVKGKGLSDAQMILSDDTGKTETLAFGADGYYHSPSGWTGETGRTYTLKAIIKGKEYSASSTMRPAVSLDSIKFVWASSAGMDMLLLKYVGTYPKTTELTQTYFLVTKNGRFYRSHADKQINPNNSISQALVGCTTKKVMEEDDPEKQDVILHEGDKVHCELWSIDQNIYDYFKSVKTSQQNASNPLSNFTKGVTGYFSAHHCQSMDITFSKSIITTMQ